MSMRYIKINNDSWDDLNKVWAVVEYSRPNPKSSATHLVLEDTSTGETLRRVVAFHEIEWLEAKDW
jgi:hypothetical protein